MKYPVKSEIQFKQTPAHIQKAINTAVCEYWSAAFSQLSLHPQTNETVSKNPEAFPELQPIPCKHLPLRVPCSQHFILLDPGSSRPLTSCATLWRDSEVWQLFAVLRSCWNLCGTACFPVPCQWGSPESRQQWEAGSQRSRGLGRLEGGSWRQTSSKVGGLVGIHRQRYTSK